MATEKLFLEGCIFSNRIEIPGAGIENKKAIQNRFGSKISVSLKRDGTLKIRPTKKMDLIKLALDIGETDIGVVIPLPEDLDLGKYFANA